MDDDDDFVSPVVKKREVKLAYFKKSPFVNEFGSSDAAEKEKKVGNVVKDLFPFSRNIRDPVNYDNRTEFDFWITCGLKKNNKYVILFFFFKLFGF